MFNDSNRDNGNADNDRDNDNGHNNGNDNDRGWASCAHTLPCGGTTSRDKTSCGQLSQAQNAPSSKLGEGLDSRNHLLLLTLSLDL